MIPLRSSSLPSGSKRAQAAVAMAASAGGLTALKRILQLMPPDFAGAILIVQHLSPKRPSFMHEILARNSKLLVKEAQEGDVLLAGHVYMAAPDHHLHVNTDRTLSLLDTAPV